MIFETHAHYDDKQYGEDREEIIEHLHEGGVGYVVNIGSSLKTSKSTLELTKKYPFIYGAVGIHPGNVSKSSDADFNEIKELSKAPKIVAIGEAGLDYYWDKDGKAKQIKWFVKHIDLARERNLPLIVHSREAAKDTLDVMKANRVEELGGVVHCFSYTVEMAKTFADMGFYIGIGGVVTFRNAKNIKEVVGALPLESILLETDCPYLAPEPYRGKRNNSVYLTHVAQAIAELKGVSYDEVIEATKKNACQMYRIKSE
jgi:TatD DNase family protein